MELIYYEFEKIPYYLVSNLSTMDHADLKANWLLHNNSSPINTEKLQYLISSLSHKPLSLIKSFPLSDGNHTVAYKSFVKRYQNTRLLAMLYWQEIDNMSKVIYEAPSSLRQILATFSENLSAFWKIGLSTDQWALVMY